MAKMALMHAVRAAYNEEMERNPDLIVMGEDVVMSLFGDTRGLWETFGSERVRNTPIAEWALSSMAVGAAMAGTPVLCHLMFGNFIYNSMDSIANQASRLRLMTGGQARLPVTFFAAMGAGSSTAAQHSDTPYPILMNLSGINVVVPATPADAKGLMKTALRSDTPTVFLVPRTRGAVTGEVPEGEYLVPFGQAAIHREGGDVTIVAIGSAVQHALAAAKTLEEQGIEADVIDPRTLVPLDYDSILKSVAKTGHLIVVDEARESCSAASQIGAVVAERAFGSLRAPIRRITTPNIGMPFAPGLEKAILPNPERIVAAATALRGKKVKETV